MQQKHSEIENTSGGEKGREELGILCGICNGKIVTAG
jgi:hypothetical protein